MPEEEVGNDGSIFQEEGEEGKDTGGGVALNGTRATSEVNAVEEELRVRLESGRSSI